MKRVRRPWHAALGQNCSDALGFIHWNLAMGYVPNAELHASVKQPAALSQSLLGSTSFKLLLVVLLVLLLLPVVLSATPSWRFICITRILGLGMNNVLYGVCHSVHANAKPQNHEAPISERRTGTLEGADRGFRNSVGRMELACLD